MEAVVCHVGGSRSRSADGASKCARRRVEDKARRSSLAWGDDRGHDLTAACRRRGRRGRSRVGGGGRRRKAWMSLLIGCRSSLPPCELYGEVELKILGPCLLLFVGRAVDILAVVHDGLNVSPEVVEAAVLSVAELAIDGVDVDTRSGRNVLICSIMDGVKEVFGHGPVVFAFVEPCHGRGAESDIILCHGGIIVRVIGIVPLLMEHTPSGLRKMN